MARTHIPTALQMRRLKYERGEPGEEDEALREERDRVAEALRAAGRRAEAVLLFQGDPDHPFLADELDWAVEAGDGFHLLAVRRLGREVGEDLLRACAQSAREHGRWMDARLCLMALGDEEGIAALAEHLPPSLRPEPPEVPADEAD
jgi:hypothetical protein